MTIHDDDALRCDALPNAVSLPFAKFNNRYSGQSCYVIGRGTTDFDYRKLSDVTDPIFLINDAVGLEQHVRAESFFFAHDPQPMVWLDRQPQIRSTAVLPIDGKLFQRATGRRWNFNGSVVYYRWREKQPGALLMMTRDQLATAKQLYTNSATIHSLIHFLWFCGFNRANLVGCDGIAQMRLTYDARLENRSGSIAGPYYPAIRQLQDKLLMALGIEGVYLGTPGPGL